VPLFGRSYTEIVTDTLSDLANNTNVTRITPGGKARAILDAVAKRLEEQYDLFDLNLARAFVSSAQGEYLNLIGTLVGASRLSSEAANVDSELQVVKFYVDSGTFGDLNGGNSFQISAGTIISTKANNNGILYRVTVPATAQEGASQVWVSVEANAPGEDSNLGTGSLVYHNFVGYTDFASSTLKVTNIHPIRNGKNFESDANFRYRIVNAYLEGEAANETAVRLAALSAAGVADVLTLRHYRGIGTFGVIIRPVTPTTSQSLLDEVELRVREVQGLGSKGYIRAVNETGVSLRTQVTYRKTLSKDEYTLIEQGLEDVIAEHIHGLGWNEPFVVNQLVSKMFAISPEISNFGDVGKPFQEVYLYKPSRLRDKRVRQTLLGDYSPGYDERVIVEPSITSPIVFTRVFNSVVR